MFYEKKIVRSTKLKVVNVIRNFDANDNLSYRFLQHKILFIIQIFILELDIML